MTDLYRMFGTDQDSETNGFWYAFSPETKFLLARAGGANTKFLKVTEHKFRPYRRELDAVAKGQKVSEEFKMLSKTLMIEIFAEAVILDWAGVKDSSGKTMKHSRDNVIKLMTDLPELFDELQSEASRLANYQVQELEDDIKN